MNSHTPRRVPTYRLHKPTGQAVVTIGGRDHYLGKHGSPASRERYARLIAEQYADPKPTAPPAAPTAVSVDELILRYWEHAETYYRDSPKELEKIRLSLGPVRDLYGRSPATQFGPLALKAVRERMAATLARTTVNMRVGVVKRVFRWAAENQLVAPGVYEGVRAVAGLRRGRTAARETEPVRPVTDAQVEAVLPLVSRQVAAMIRVQRLTGARSGEVCCLRPMDVDQTGSVWTYRPARHKNRYRGHERQIHLGPRAQQVLLPFLSRDPAAFAFSPREAAEERNREKRKRRRSRVQPSQRDRRRPDARRTPGDAYSVRAYYRAVRRACLRAGIEPWHPHQLRHAAATALRREFGVEVARVILGHKTAFTTEIYAEADQAKAAGAVALVG